VPNGRPDVLLLATGSEVGLCLSAREQLLRQGINARVVSMPCWRLFEEQSQAYRDSVLPPDVKARVSVEEGTTFGWERYVGETGASLSIDTFGASAPLKALQQKFGFTPERILHLVSVQLQRTALSRRAA
jgi:transketolase